MELEAKTSRVGYSVPFFPLHRSSNNILSPIATLPTIKQILAEICKRRKSMEAENAWRAVLGQLQMEMPKASFDTWVRDTEFLSFEDDTFSVGVQNTYCRDWLDNRLTSTVARLLTGMMNKTVEVEFVVHVASDNEVDESPYKEEDTQPATLAPSTTLNPMYTFDNFVVTSNNRLAQAASFAVTEKPGIEYNPLLIYGPTGLGKTHLLHAIGNVCHENGYVVLYATSEEFTNDLVTAIKIGKTQALRKKYRGVDVLLMDDIAFLAGKEASTEEFFHTFNALVEGGKQVVLTSELAPRDLTRFDERLRTRFIQGFPVDIRPPDFESRLATLQFICDKQGWKLPADVIETIAHIMKRNVRVLTVALRRVDAMSNLQSISATPKLAKQWIMDLIPEPTSDPDRIVEAVLSFFNLREDQLLSKNREHAVSHPRHIAMFLLREESELSLSQIGERLGGRDHSTVLYGVDKIADLIEKDPLVGRAVQEVKGLFKPELLAA